jgi:hypothetical protein
MADLQPYPFTTVYPNGATPVNVSSGNQAAGVSAATMPAVVVHGYNI